MNSNSDSRTNVDMSATRDARALTVEKQCSDDQQRRWLSAEHEQAIWSDIVSLLASVPNQLGYSRLFFLNFDFAQLGDGRSLWQKHGTVLSVHVFALYTGSSTCLQSCVAPCVRVSVESELPLVALRFVYVSQPRDPAGPDQRYLKSRFLG